MNSILIVAHAPLASALRQCVQHVFPEHAASVAALDVQPDASPEDALTQARALLAQLGTSSALLLTDVLGATPCNVAQQLVDGVNYKLLAGVNLPMLLRAVAYRHETLDALVVRALLGATQGVLQVTRVTPQNQTNNLLLPQDHDQNPCHHQ